jgi:hypothetical protein
MRRLLDYTRSGRWLTLSVDAAPTGSGDNRATSRQIGERADSRIERAEEIQAPAAIRRLLEYTISGHWRSPGEAPLELAAGDEARQQLCDAAFFGLDVNEIPAEKWREIAPLFHR